jgi:hypothetical protein
MQTWGGVRDGGQWHVRVYGAQLVPVHAAMHIRLEEQCRKQVLRRTAQRSSKRPPFPTHVAQARQGDCRRQAHMRGQEPSASPVPSEGDTSTAAAHRKVQ